MLTVRQEFRVYFVCRYARAEVFGYTPTPVGRDSVRPLGED
jgi:hypothetical protein